MWRASENGSGAVRARAISGAPAGTYDARPRFGVWAATGTLLLASPLWLVVAQWRPQWDPAVMAQTQHFWVVSGAALMASGLAAVVIASARSLRHTQALFVALGFLALSAIFSAHGLTTWPGKQSHVHPYDPSGTVVSAWLSLAAAALFIGIGSLRLGLRQQAFVAKHGHRLFLGVLVVVVGYTIATVFVDGLWGWIPWRSTSFRLITTGASVGLFLVGAYRYARVWWLVGLSIHGSMAVAMVLLAESQLIMATREAWHLSWWIYHVLLVIAFTVLLVSWALEARRARSLSVIAEGLALQGALSGLKPAAMDGVARLLDALEVKDPVTSGHVFRVQEHAEAIARELHLGPDQTEYIGIAGKLHDIGKIGTPDHILLKPGKLTPAEYQVVQEHAPRGHRIASRVSMLRRVREIIRAHHERFDGAGYPDGLKGEEIPIEARIIAVADTFDAMTSDRPYKKALSIEAALDELRRVAGTQLDPRCVAAFEQIASRKGAFDIRLATDAGPQPAVLALDRS